MLPPAGVGMNLEPIRLCAACYLESPYHRIEWQFKVTQGCQHHHLSLLPEFLTLAKYLKLAIINDKI